MLEIRHNQIRQSSSVRQKNPKLASIGQVGIFVLQLVGWLQAIGLQAQLVENFNLSFFHYLELGIYLDIQYTEN